MGIPAYNDLERMASVFRVFEGYENLLVPQQVPDADYAVIQDDHEEEEHDFPDVMSRYLRAQRDLAENTAIHRQEGNREIAVEGSWDDDVEAQEEVSDRETGVLSGLSDLIDAVREASRDNDERIEDAYEIVNEDLPMAGDTDESAFDDNEAVFVDVDQPVDENLVEAVNMGQGTDNNVAEEQASNAIVVEVVHTGDRHPNDSVEEQHAPHINIEEDIQPNADHNISGPAQAAPHEQIFDLFAFDDKTLPPRRPTPNISNEAWDDIWHILSDPEVVNRGGVPHF
ncbi:hypothetical protein M7I_3150 [Glarea lozoyensis 74030]|uniref:Uncharacterized protein n=1 Tax=Glarea lozoyensis (strain ATCC 74030 / MF5533) TaxID=1104152 RepID=H0EKS1_GLAL7|nr:hypothetical protein M7I_3150 [Glarea lozoyensis 74030]